MARRNITAKHAIEVVVGGPVRRVVSTSYARPNTALELDAASGSLGLDKRPAAGSGVRVNRACGQDADSRTYTFEYTVVNEPGIRTVVECGLRA